MTVKITLEDEFYTEKEIAVIYQLPIAHIVAVRGCAEWPPFTIVDGTYFYRKSIADFHIFGEEGCLCRSAIYRSADGPQIMVDTLGYEQSSLTQYSPETSRDDRQPKRSQVCTSTGALSRWLGRALAFAVGAEGSHKSGVTVASRRS